MRPSFLPLKPAPVEVPKTAIRKLVDEVGGVKRAAIRLGRAASTVYSYCDPQSSDEPTFAQVAALTGRESPAAARYLAAVANGVFVPIEPSDAPLAALQASTVREHAEALAAMIERQADGHFSPDDARAALREIDEAITALVQLRCAVAAVITPANSRDEGDMQ